MLQLILLGLSFIFIFIIINCFIFSGQYDQQQRRRISLIEESILPQISTLILHIPNRNLRFTFNVILSNIIVFILTIIISFVVDI